MIGTSIPCSRARKYIRATPVFRGPMNEVSEEPPSGKITMASPCAERLHAFVEKGGIVDGSLGFLVAQHGDRPHPAQDEADDGDLEQRGLGDVPQSQGRTEKKRQEGIEKIVGMIRGEDHGARSGQVLPPLDDDLAEEDFPDEAEKAQKHARLSSLSCLLRW